MGQESLEDQDSTVTIGRITDLVSSEDLAGTVFAQKYEMLELLGQGGMSAVYRARHIGMDKIVAVKVLHLHLAKDELSQKRFKQEAHAASTLAHAGIVAIHDYGETEGGTPYLIMDYVEGESLSDWLEKNGVLALEQFLSIMEQVAAALAHAHDSGIAHRDLKPSNIMIAQAQGKNQVKIVDFGIAKVLSQSREGAQQLTQTGEVFGSPLYMSPEQCTGAHCDQRTDIYSLGCVMYESLSGRPPFKGDAVFETINKHINELPPPLVAPGLEEAAKKKLELILLRCMAKAPEDRFQSMSEIERELRGIRMKSGPGLLGVLGGAWELAAAKRRASRKNRLPLVVVTLSVVSCLSILSVLLLLGGLKRAGEEIDRLEQSRAILSEISLAQADFTKISDAGTTYFTLLFFAPEKAPLLAEQFEKSILSTHERLNKVDKVLALDPKMQKKFREVWRPRLTEASYKSRDELEKVLQQGFGMKTMSTGLKLSRIYKSGASAFMEMSGLARKVEKEQMGKFKHTEVWIASMAIFCAGLNGTVVLVLFFYFAKGTPQRLKLLAQQAALLSRKKGAQTASNEDIVDDLDSVLQELAAALSDAEAREKELLLKLKAQEEKGVVE